MDNIDSFRPGRCNYESNGKRPDGWVCLTCGFLSKKKSTCASHVESKHVLSEGFHCPYCGLFCPNRKSLRNHTDRHHKDKC